MPPAGAQANLQVLTLVNDLRRGEISVEQITQKMIQFQKKLDESFSTSDKVARLNKELE